MTILVPESDSTHTAENIALRTETACLKLTLDEFRSVQEISTANGVTRGEWMRDVVLCAVQMGKARLTGDLTLNEIVGVQLLLMNVLRPIATGQPLTAAAFDNIVTEVHKMKKTVARKLTQEEK
jgi:hypothetical protein